MTAHVISTGRAAWFIAGPEMSKQPESAADRLWREKLDLGISLREAVVTIVALAVVSALIAFS